MKRLLLFLTCVAVLTGGCVTEQAVRHDAEVAAEPVRAGPEKPAVKTITNFTPALRCMDNMLITYGIRDLVVISEDIDDKTKKVSAGTKDMLISAVSEMTRRSRAIRLIAFGGDSYNLNNFMNMRESKSLYQLQPQFSIRGSISQFDENIAKETEGGGFAIESFFSAGKASSASISILGLDLSMVNAMDLTVLPGVTSNNSVAIMRSSSGTEAEAGYHKFGINYQMNLARSDGMSQALRHLVELATVELFGKLTMTPYWTCLGSTVDAPEVQTEIYDWYITLSANPRGFITYWQEQMRLRHLYHGEIDGVGSDDGFRVAVETYRAALGLERINMLDPPFFTAYLGADHQAIMHKAQVMLSAPSAPTPVSAPVPNVESPAATSASKPIPAPVPLRLALSSTNGNNSFRPGENIVLKLAPSRDAYIYCFMQDENQAIMRFFPNRFIKDAFVPVRGMNLPKNGEFSINASGGRETIACFATDRDVFTYLPASIASGDFEALSVKNLAELKATFQRLGGVGVEFPIQIR
jgi:curli biogenesis system outer membrane secretion channel CsgG